MTKFYIQALEAKKIADALTVCISKEETRYYLNGVCIENTAKEGLIAIATDGHRLGQLKLAPLDIDAISAAPVADEFTYILPVDAVTWLGKLPARYTDVHLVQFDFSETKVTLSLLPTVMSATFNLIDGNFPDWRRVIPAAVADTIGFSSVYLKELATSIKKASDRKTINMRFGITDHNSPCVIKGEDEALSYILMPMRGANFDNSLQARGATILRQLEALANEYSDVQRSPVSRQLRAIAESLKEVTDPQTSEDEIISQENKEQKGDIATAA